MKTTRRRRNRQEWIDLTEEWRLSGLTGTEFSRRKGLNPSTFAWWRSELNTKELVESKLTLIPVPNPLPTLQIESLEVVLPSGIFLRIPASADLRQAADLVTWLLEA